MLKLAEANRAIVAAQTYARDHGHFISVTVCDSMGQLIAHQRMDDAAMPAKCNETDKTVFNNRAMTAHVSLKQRNWSNRERKE